MRKVSFPSLLKLVILFWMVALILPTAAQAQTQTTVSINAGGAATGSFTADQYFSGGTTYTNTATIDMSQIPSNPPPVAIFNTERYGAMTYTIPNRSGAQTVTLYFAETYLSGAGQRLFNVTINGSTVLSNFDIYASAGGANRAIAQTFNTTANASGQVVIQFTAVTQNPKINGITVAGAITPTPTPTIPPGGSVSINSGGAATGSFTADQYFSGGSTYTNTRTIDTSQVGSVPAAIFSTERYGAMTYTIPNRSGNQVVTLYFAETYVTAAGQRVFNVSINGSTVLSNFDIFAAAGGADRAIARTFNTTANASGQVVIQFTAVTQNPKINGLTVVNGEGGNTLTVTKNGSGSGSGTVTSSPAGINCGSTCSANYASGTSVTLSYTLLPNTTFGGWGGACSGTAATCTVSMTQSQTVTATFNSTLGSFNLTVAKGGMGTGTVTSSPAGINCGTACSATYLSGTSVTLTAQAGTNSTFGGWSGACSGTGTCTVTMNTNQTVTATFNSSGDVRPSAGCGKTRTLQNGTITIQSGGVNRSYILRAPDNYSNTRPYRLIVAYHWLNGSAQNVASGNYYGLLPLSNNSTIFVAPQGLDAGWANTNNRDLILTDAILAQVGNELCIDQNRIWSTGFSYGAGMSYAVACARANVFRGVALYAGAQLSGCSGGTAPIAYFAAHGISDSVLNISQGRTLRNRFVTNNSCTAQNPPEPAAGSGTHICTTYQGCSAGRPVTWCAFDGDHTPNPVDRGQSTSWVPQQVWNFIAGVDGGQ